MTDRPDNSIRSASRRPARVFISYSRADTYFLKRLTVYLSPLRSDGVIDYWDDEDLVPGSEWSKEIQQRMEQADAIIFLISPDSLATDFIENYEVRLAMARHSRKEAVVIPVLLKKVATSTHPLLSLGVLPRKCHAVTDKAHHTEEDAFFEVAEGIGQAVKIHMGQAIRHSKETEEIRTQSIARVYLVHAVQDSDDFDRMLLHLRPLEEEGFWRLLHDGIETSDRTRAEKLYNTIESANVVVVMLTPTLLADQEFKSEVLPQIMEWHRQGRSLVFPVIARPCLWQVHELANFPIIFPQDRIAISRQASVDETCAEIAQQLGIAVAAALYEL